YEAISALMYVIPGMPLIYSGQEVGLDKRLAFFEKDQIEWKDSEWTSHFTDLNGLKKHLSALDVGPSAGSFELVSNTDSTHVLSFRRAKGEAELFAVFNLSSDTR
ncbi:hypothetical protein RZS08_65900, partial [Arthrospira platensis SPKY1]|nr:hypothetical protein [Arthrospira platensis SPKY1]